MYTQKPLAGSSKGTVLEHEWRMRMVNEAPNGKLLVSNSVFDVIRSSSKIYMTHITPNLERIIQSGSIYSSGGCLLGGIYTTPIFQEEKGLRVHNLGRYIMREEAPRASYLQKKNNPDALVIELTIPPESHKNLIGVDYTRLGNIHFGIYKELEYLLSFRERVELHDVILRKIKNSLAFLNMINDAFVTGSKPDPKDFFSLFLKSIDDLPVLGYLYFEALSEYIMLFEDSAEARKSHELGEIYNYSYKNLMFDLFPDMLLGRSLGTFNPHPDRVAEYIAGKGVFTSFSKEHLLDHLVDRLVLLANTRLFNDQPDVIRWRELKWDFDSLEKVASQLLGHLIHREFRNFGRYPDFYFYFDQFKALQIWNYWNNMDVAIPFNGYCPKGEIGINPAWPDLEYNIFRADQNDDPSGEIYLEPKEELDVRIVPRLVNIKYSMMRSRDKKTVDDRKSGTNY